MAERTSPAPSSRPRRMVFVMDPIQQVDVDADTTFALMLAAQERGIENWYVAPEALTVQPQSGPSAIAQRATLRRERGDPVRLESPQLIALDEMEVIWQRKDPPVDESYTRATQMLALCQRARVLNRPTSVLAFNEKLFALEFPELMPATCVARRIVDLEGFLADQQGEMIVKPLDGKGGEGIFHIRRGDPNVRTILEGITAFETRWAMGQAYVPKVRQGDKRILLVDGEPLGAVLRIPAKGESRANLHSGGRAAQAGLDPDDLRIVAALAPRLRAEGLFFVGIDVIGGLLTEINVTSPTGIQEMSRLDRADYPAEVLDRLERLLARS